MNFFVALTLLLSLAGLSFSQVVDPCPTICRDGNQAYPQAQTECNQALLLNLCDVEKCAIDGATGFQCTKPQDSFIVSNQVFDTNSVDVIVEYSWGEGQTDLDSATEFLDFVSGVGCGDQGPFMTFSGDITGSGGVESTAVDIELARQQGFWTEFTAIEARAQWFSIPDQGPANLRLFLRDRATGNMIEGSELPMIINPANRGTGPTCASAKVSSVFIRRGFTETRFMLSQQFPVQVIA
ncbi:hypothetical protein FGB62_144g02 [Gracilaria domingensis]|nr:hypothetical protein FGB62_144g02 [Gracilaria domingensis]